MRQPSRRSVLAAAGAGITGALAGCVGGDRSPQVRNATRELEPAATEATPLDASSFDSRWATQVPGEFTLSTPGIDGDRLYVGSGTVLTAIDRAGGDGEWQRDLGAMTHGFSAAVTDDLVVAAARDLLNRRRLVDRGGRPSVTALDPATGQTVWRERLPVSGSPVVAGENVLVPLVTDDGTALSARALATGEEHWRTPLSTPDVFSAPAVGDGVYVATVGDEEDRSRLVALTPDGTVRWTTTLDGAPHKGPTVATRDGGDVVYVGTDAGYVYAVGGDGEMQFQAALGDGVNTTPVVDGDRVYATTPERVVALDADSGAGQWLGVVDHVAKTGLGVGGGMVHVGGNEVAAFAADDGTPEWRVALPGVAGTFGSPLHVDGTLYAGGCVKTDGNSRYDHTVWALE